MNSQENAGESYIRRKGGLLWGNILPKIKEGETIGIIIGSEGGFSRKEVDYAIKNGYESISLGKRILRTETASIVGASTIMFALER